MAAQKKNLDACQSGRLLKDFQALARRLKKRIELSSTTEGLDLVHHSRVSFWC